MRAIYAFTEKGETIRFEIQDDWTITFGTAQGNSRAFGNHELRVYSDGKKNQRLAMTGVITFWEETMNVRRVVVGPEKTSAKAEQVEGQMSTDDFEETELVSRAFARRQEEEDDDCA